MNKGNNLLGIWELVFLANDVKDAVSDISIMFRMIDRFIQLVSRGHGASVQLLTYRPAIGLMLLNTYNIIMLNPSVAEFFSKI